MTSLRCLVALLTLAGACTGDDAPEDEREGGAFTAGASSDASSPGDAAGSGSVDAEAGAPPATRDAAPDPNAPVVRDASVDAAQTVPQPPDAAAPTPDAGASCAAPALCTDFEGDAPGALPGAWSGRTPNCSGDGRAEIDSRVAHGGSKSLRVQSGGGTCNHIFAAPALDFGALGDAFWVRFYVRFDNPLVEDHVTFLAMHDQVSGKALRMGGQKKVLSWNRESDDATLPELSPNGVAMSVAPRPGEFHCVEFHLDGSHGALETYVDGALVPGLVIDAAATHDIDGQWLRPGAWSADVSEIGLGWESYGSASMLLWFDDIAITRGRAGC
jgi:hypothetical protein